MIRRRRWGQVAMLLLGAVSVLALTPHLGATAAPKRESWVRSESKTYNVSPGARLDCATNQGGACFSLIGDERSTGILVLDDEGWMGVPFRYAFGTAAGETLAEGTQCDKGWVDVPDGAQVLAVEVAPLTLMGPCNLATVTASGEITVTYDLKPGGKQPPLDNERTCIGGFVPEPLSMQLQGDSGQRITLDTLVISDGVDPAYAQQSMARVVSAYDRIGIDVSYQVREVTLATAPDPALGGLYDDEAIFAEVKALLGGSVPTGFDVVHTMTTKDLSGKAGVAYCVGGIRARTHAFSISEEIPGKVPNLIRGVPVPVWPWEGAGYITAHEIGHLLGGNHDYANCVEGGFVVTETVPGPCTIMHANFNISFAFSTLNRIEMRGYALRFAAP